MAPVPDGRNYTESEQLALEFDTVTGEAHFRDKYRQDEWIPEDYLDLFENMLRSIVEFIDYVNRRPNKNQSVYGEFTCPICHVEITARLLKSHIIVRYVIVRPCAEHLGFYKLILWALKYCIHRFNYKSLYFENVLESNLQILEGLGFRSIVNDLYGYYDCVLNDIELLRITSDQWRLSGMLNPHKTIEDYGFFYHYMFPSSHRLNDQEFVNAKFEKSRRKRIVL